MSSVRKLIKFINKNIDRRLITFASKKELSDRVESIERSINAHAIGVQNVYNEIKELKEFYKLASSGNDLENILREMKGQIAEIINIRKKFEWNIKNKGREMEKLNKILELLE